MFYKKPFLQVSQYWQENTCCWCLFFIKLQGFTPATLLKKRLQHRCFPVSIAKFVRTPILKNIGERLLLENWVIPSDSELQEEFLETFLNCNCDCNREVKVPRSEILSGKRFFYDKEEKENSDKNVIYLS